MFVLPDTNFFLHFTHPREVRWSDIGAGQDVRIVCTRTIQSELDKKKHELKGRAQQRAREFARLFLEAALNSEPTTLRETNPRVTLQFFERPTSFAVPATLNTAGWGDDSFVADSLAFLDARPGESTLLISGDAGPILTARAHAVPCRPLHDLGWELPPETDERGKLVESLQREVKQLQGEMTRSGPQIEGRFNVPENAHKVETTLLRYPALNGGVSDALVEELCRLHPKVSDFPPPLRAGGSGWIAPTEAEVQTYSGRYNAWLDQACALLSKLPEALTEPETRVATGFTVRNAGVAPAEHVLVEFRSSEGLRLLFPKRRDDDEETEVAVVTGKRPLRLAAPPIPPRWKAPPPPVPPLPANAQRSLQALQIRDVPRHGLSSLYERNNALESARAHSIAGNVFGNNSDLIRQLTEQRQAYAFPVPVLSGPLTLSQFPQPLDDDSFYIRDGERGFPTDKFSFERTRFRHGSSAHTFTFEVSFDPESSVRGGQVEVEVHAGNLRVPFRAKLAVVRNIQDADLVKEARAALGLPPLVN